MFKLFVWEGVLCDYGCGLVCILAEDLEQASALLSFKYPEYAERIPVAPTRIVSSPEAFAIHGGG